MKPLLIANWKMNLTVAAARELAAGVAAAVSPFSAEVAIGVCPSFTAIDTVRGILHATPVAWGAQNVYWEATGAFTGEISPLDLAELGCRYGIVGHSERRQYFGETDETVSKKAQALVAHGIAPIICIGETEEERQAGQTEAVISAQLAKCLKTLSDETARSLVIAYEPVWAIGTGKTPTPQEAQAVHALIRRILIAQFPRWGRDMPLLYGGSASPETAVALIEQPEINGFLVGGASLKVESFVKMVEIVAKVGQ